MERLKEDIFNLFLMIDNLIRLGCVERTGEGRAFVRFSEDCALWLSMLSLRSGVSFALRKDDAVLVFSPGGDLTHGLILGALTRDGTASDIFSVEAHDGFRLSNGKDELLSLIVEALKVIAGSKTTTLMGPQPSTDCVVRLPEIITKIEALRC